MTAKWWRPNYCPIGIDLGSSSVKLIQLERVGDRLRVVAAASGALPQGIDPYSSAYHEAVGDVIKRGLNQGAFRGKACISSMPSAVMQYKNLRLPVMPEAELAAAVRWEAADRVRYQGQTPVVQFFDAGDVRQGTDTRREVIVVAAPDRFIEQHTAMLQSVGLQPAAIDAAPAALARCLHESSRLSELVQPEPAERENESAGSVGIGSDAEAAGEPVQVILEFGNSSSNIVIAQGGSVVFFKQLPIGSSSLDDAAVQALGWSEEQAASVRRGDKDDDGSSADHAALQTEYAAATQMLVNDLGREVGLCLRYYTVTFRGARPESVGLIGGAGDQAFADRLTPLAGVTIEPTNPLEGVDITPVRGDVPRRTHAAWGLAAGLSLRDHASCQCGKGAA